MEKVSEGEKRRREMHGGPTKGIPPSSRKKNKAQAEKKKRSPKKSLMGPKTAGAVEPQQSREKTAELYFAAGLNCEQAIFAAFADVLGMSLVAAQQKAPLRKQRGPMCGAYIAGVAVLTRLFEGERESPSDAFKERFIREFGSLECARIREGRKDCLDVIGRTARLLDEIITQYKL